MRKKQMALETEDRQEIHIAVAHDPRKWLRKLRDSERSGGLFAFMVLLALVCLSMAAFSDCTTITSYNYRNYTITNTDAAATNAQVKINVAAITNTGADMRWYWYNGTANVSINFWRSDGTDGDTAWSTGTKSGDVWFVVPTLANGNNTIYLRWNFTGDTCSDLSSAAGVFYFYDPCNNISQWTNMSGSGWGGLLLANGTCYFNSPAPYSGEARTTSYQTNASYTLNFQQHDADKASIAYTEFKSDGDTGAQAANTYHGHYDAYTTGANITNGDFWSVNGSGYVKLLTVNGGGMTGWLNWELKVNASTVMVYKNQIYAGNYTNTTYRGGYLGFSFGSNQTDNAAWDNIRVRSYFLNEPTSSAGNDTNFSVLTISNVSVAGYSANTAQASQWKCQVNATGNGTAFSCGFKWYRNGTLNSTVNSVACSDNVWCNSTTNITNFICPATQQNWTCQANCSLNSDAAINATMNSTSYTYDNSTTPLCSPYFSVALNSSNCTTFYNPFVQFFFLDEVTSINSSGNATLIFWNNLDGWESYQANNTSTFHGCYLNGTNWTGQVATYFSNSTNPYIIRSDLFNANQTTNTTRYLYLPAYCVNQTYNYPVDFAGGTIYAYFMNYNSTPPVWSLATTATILPDGSVTVCLMPGVQHQIVTALPPSYGSGNYTWNYTPPSPNPIPINLFPQTLPPYWSYNSSLISYTCSFDNATKTINCTYTDNTNVTHTFWLNSSRLGYGNPVQVCNATATGASGTLLCTISDTNITGNVYNWALTAVGFQQPIAQGLIDWRTTAFKTIGPALSYLLIVVTGLLALFNPIVAVIFGAAGVVLASLMGLLQLDITAVAGIVLVAMLLAWRMSRY